MKEILLEKIKKLVNSQIPSDLSLNDLKKIENHLIKTKNLKKIKLIIDGDPVSWKRAVKTKSHYYDPNGSYKMLVVNALNNALESVNLDKDKLIENQVYLEVIAYKLIPKNTPKYKKFLMLEDVIQPTIKPDFDNILKNIADSLNSILYRDDSQITFGSIKKKYSDSNPRIEIFISFID
jgi:Holliday junction resolvase RusA-like endonuclease